MGKSLLDEIQDHRKNIKHESLSFSLAELVNMYKDEEIVVRPEFQRLFRWSREKQSRFIESILLDVPIPPLFFFERDGDGKWELLDGLQRLSTIIRVLGAKHDIPAEYQGETNNAHEWHETHENDTDYTLQFVAGEYLKQLSGLTFNRLPMQLQLNLKRARLHIYVLKRETHRMYKYEVFKRLNTGGAPLEEQEIRNCAVRLISDVFPQFIQDISKDKNFQEALGLSSTNLRNGAIEELALRFFAMKNWLGGFSHDVDEFLTAYMEQVAEGKIGFNYIVEKQSFEDTWQLICAAMPGGEAFQGKSDDGRSYGPFSPVLYEISSIAVASNIAACRKLSLDQLKERLNKLIIHARVNGLTGAGTNSRKKTQGRMELAKSWFS